MEIVTHVVEKKSSIFYSSLPVHLFRDAFTCPKVNLLDQIYPNVESFRFRNYTSRIKDNVGLEKIKNVSTSAGVMTKFAYRKIYENVVIIKTNFLISVKKHILYLTNEDHEVTMN